MHNSYLYVLLSEVHVLTFQVKIWDAIVIYSAFCSIESLLVFSILEYISTQATYKSYLFLIIRGYLN